MTSAEISANLKTFAVAAIAIAAVLGIQGALDRLERDQKDRLQYRQWVADACTPNDNETAIAKREGGKLRCTIYARDARGFVPIVVSAAVMEVPQ